MLKYKAGVLKPTLTVTHDEDVPETYMPLKAVISNITGEIRSFIWFKERKDQLQLSREACYQKAIEFLEHKSTTLVSTVTVGSLSILPYFG